jgi:hypothetical protein
MNWGMLRLLLLFFCVLPPYAAAAADIPDSLFLTEAEQTPATPPTPGRPTRTALDAIVYYGPEQWQIWINGRPYKPDSPSDDLTIVAVTAEAVTLEQTRDADGPVRFTLAPHQSYDWTEQRVIEGAP